MYYCSEACRRTQMCQLNRPRESQDLKREEHAINGAESRGGGAAQAVAPAVNVADLPSVAAVDEPGMEDAVQLWLEQIGLAQYL